MPGLVEVDLANRLESANRHIAELEIAKAAAAIELDIFLLKTSVCSG